jgi:hypothetical protein
MYMAKSSINYDELNDRFEENFEPVLDMFMQQDASFLEQHSRDIAHGTIVDSAFSPEYD